MLINFYKYKKVNHGSPFFISMATNANILRRKVARKS
jgi:hypothetical protein